jgi:ATP-binding cassette, subfamily B, multidrug efflux pump
MRQLLNAISRRIEADLRDAFFAHLIRLDATFFTATRTGDLMSRATNDLQAVRQATGPGVMYLVNTIIGTAAALFFMMRYSPRLTAIALVPLALLPVVMKYFGRVIHQKAERIQDHFGHAVEHGAGEPERRAHHPGVRAGGGPGIRVRRAEPRVHGRNMSLARTSALFHPLLSILTGLGLLAVLWFGGLQVIAARSAAASSSPSSSTSPC